MVRTYLMVAGGCAGGCTFAAAAFFLHVHERAARACHELAGGGAYPAVRMKSGVDVLGPPLLGRGLATHARMHEELWALAAEQAVHAPPSSGCHWVGCRGCDAAGARVGREAACQRLLHTCSSTAHPPANNTNNSRAGREAGAGHGGRRGLCCRYLFGRAGSRSAFYTHWGTQT